MQNTYYDNLRQDTLEKDILGQETTESIGILKILEYVFTSPKKLFAQLHELANNKTLFKLFLISAISISLIKFIRNYLIKLDREISYLIGGFFGGIVGIFIVIILLSSIIFVLGKLFKSKAIFKEIFTIIIISYLVIIPLTFFSSLSNVLLRLLPVQNNNNLDFVCYVICATLQAVFVLWCMFITFKGLHFVQKIKWYQLVIQMFFLFLIILVAGNIIDLVKTFG